MTDLFKTKTFWAGIGLMLTGVGTILKTGDIASGTEAIAEGFAVIFLRAGVAKVGRKAK